MKKICKKCGEEKELEEFSFHSKNIRRNVCKTCISIQLKINYLNKKTDYSKKSKIYYQKK